MYRHRRKSDIVVCCTKEEAVEIEAKYTFYYTEFQKDLTIFYSAFVMRNSIYPKDPKEDDADVTVTDDDIKAYRLSQNLSVKEYRKRLNE